MIFGKRKCKKPGAFVNKAVVKVEDVVVVEGGDFLFLQRSVRPKTWAECNEK